MFQNPIFRGSNHWPMKLSRKRNQVGTDLVVTQRDIKTGEEVAGMMQWDLQLEMIGS